MGLLHRSRGHIGFPFKNNSPWFFHGEQESEIQTNSREADMAEYARQGHWRILLLSIILVNSQCLHNKTDVLQTVNFLNEKHSLPRRSRGSKVRMCSPDIDLLFPSIRFIYRGSFRRYLYIHPKANVGTTTWPIVDMIHRLQSIVPDAPWFILGDFNHCRPGKSLPNFYPAPPDT